MVSIAWHRHEVEPEGDRRHTTVHTKHSHTKHGHTKLSHAKSSCVGFVTLKSFRCSEKALDSATLPVSNETRLPPPRAWLMCSLCPGSLGRPG